MEAGSGTNLRPHLSGRKESETHERIIAKINYHFVAEINYHFVLEIVIV